VVVSIPPSSSIVSLPKISEKISRKMIGSRIVKKTEAGFRQKIRWSKRNWCSASAGHVIAP
jgi:hypothetical protein